MPLSGGAVVPPQGRRMAMRRQSIGGARHCLWTMACPSNPPFAQNLPTSLVPRLDPQPDYTLLKPKRHSLRCHDFMVHALLLRMHTNVVYFRAMRRPCRREWNWLWNWQCVNQQSWDPWQRTRDHGVWRIGGFLLFPTDWREGEPNYLTEEKCVELHYGTWFNTACTNYSPAEVVCQV